MVNPNNGTSWESLTPHAPPPSGPPRWLLSFVDLTGVLVAFFVLLFSMRAPDMGRWEMIQKAMHKAFVPRPTVLTVQANPTGKLNGAAPLNYQKNDGALYLQQLLQRRLQGDAFWSLTQGEVVGDGFNLPLPPALLQPKAGENTAAALTPAGKDAIARLAEVIRNWDNPMVVNVAGADQTRWENLSSARALQKALEAAGVNVKGVVFSGVETPGTALSLRVMQND